MFNFFLTHSPLLYLTQSLWRDEAFSVLLAQKPLAFLLTHVTIEPPLYYIGLHFWISIFGTSEIAVRGFSFMGFCLATTLVIFMSERIFIKNFLSWFTPLLFFTNPMLLYYAFETRAYGWFMFFVIASIFAYLEKRWNWWAIATIFGFYTHSYMVFVLITQVVHYLTTQKTVWITPIKQWIRKQEVIASIVVATACIPWVIHAVRLLAHQKGSWYYPVDFNLITSVLGNQLIGYEGTPGYLWGWTKLLSLIIIIMMIMIKKHPVNKTINRFFLLLVAVPLTLVLGVSLVKPIYVMRYLLPVTIAEIFLVALWLRGVTNKTMQIWSTVTIMIATIGFTIWYPNKHAKLDIRTTVQQVNQLIQPTDTIYAESPLVFFETIYYSKNPKNVYLYNPGGVAFPWYIGDAIVDSTMMKTELPLYPNRAFMIADNGTFDVAFTIPFIQKKK